MARVMPKALETVVADPPKRRRGRPRRTETVQTAPVVAAPTGPSMPSNLYEVVRPIKRGAGVVEPVGKILDATGWPVGRAKQLVSQRYLKPAGA